MSVQFCLIGGLYHAITRHEAKRIDTYLVVLAIVWLVSNVLSWMILNGGAEDNTGGGIGGIAIGAVIWGIFIWYCHGYADLIRKLAALGYPINECVF